MSLSADGAWKAGVWNSTVWGQSVWWEAAPIRRGGAKNLRKKKDYFVQDDLYDQRTKITAEVPDSVHPPVKPEKVKPVKRQTIKALTPPATIDDVRPPDPLSLPPVHVSVHVSVPVVEDEDIELVMMVLDALDEAA